MITLSIETSGMNCGLGIWVDNELINIREEIVIKKHSEKLPEYTNQILRESKIKLKQIDLISVSSGPGSYTGLRVGMSFAKGLAFGSNIQLIPINTFSSIEYKYNINNEHIVLIYSHSDFVYTKNRSNNKGIIQTKIESLYEKSLICVNFPEKYKNLKNAKYILPSTKYIGEYSNANYSKLKKLSLHDISTEYFSEFKIRN